MGERFTEEVANALRQRRPEFFKQAFDLLIAETPGIDSRDIAALVGRQPPLPGQWEQLIASLTWSVVEEADNCRLRGDFSQGNFRSLAGLLAAWYVSESRTSDVIWLVTHAGLEVQSNVLRALEGGLYEPRFAEFIGEFVCSEGISSESRANAVGVILVGEGWCPKVEAWLSRLVLQIMTLGVEECPNEELKVLSDYLFTTHDEEDADASNLPLPKQAESDQKIVNIFLPLLCHNDYTVRREILYALKALVSSSVVLQECAISLLKSEDLDWVDCAMFVLEGVQSAEIREARNLLAQNVNLFATWLVDESAINSVWDIIEELCVEGYFQELPAVGDFEGAAPGASRFLGTLIRVKAAIGLLTVAGQLEPYLRSSNQEISKGAIDAFGYIRRGSNRIELFLRSIAYDSNHPLWRNVVTVLQERLRNKRHQKAKREWSSRRKERGIPRWLYPILPKIVNRAQDIGKAGSGMALSALCNSIDAPEVRNAILRGVESDFRRRPGLVASPLSRLVREELSVEELVEYTLFRD
jgi:hypothetical protein